VALTDNGPASWRRQDVASRRIDFATILVPIRTGVERDLARPGLPREKVLARARSTCEITDSLGSSAAVRIFLARRSFSTWDDRGTRQTGDSADVNTYRRTRADDTFTA